MQTAMTMNTLGLGLGGVQPAAPTAATAVDGGNPSGSNDDDGDASGVRIGGGATRQAILPVTDTGLGDDFIDFDDDPDLPEDAIHEAPLVNIPAEDEDEDAGADADCASEGTDHTVAFSSLLGSIEGVTSRSPGERPRGIV